MAVPARIYEEEEERVPLRLVPGGKTRTGRATAVATRPRSGAQRQDARPFRRIYVTALVVCAALVVLGLGPVFLAAQATRDSQQSVLIQESLDAANARSEQLEMQHSVLTSSLRVNTIATTKLGMVPATAGQMTVNLETPKPQVAAAKKPAQAARTAQASPAQKSRSTLGTLARLTAGQAGSLLVGDVGLAATR